MKKYLITRIFFFFPTMLAITLVAFAISIHAPGDPIERISEGMVTISEKEYLRQREKLGLNLPVFYLSLSAYAEPDTLFNIPRPHDREIQNELVYVYGNWPEISSYYNQAKSFRKNFKSQEDQFSYDLRKDISQRTEELLALTKDELIRRQITHIGEIINSNPELAPLTADYNQTQKLFEKMILTATPWKIYIPKIHFYGFQNQYHRWLVKMLHGDFGISYSDKRPVASKFPEAMRWSILLNVISVLIAFMVSIPLGIYSALYRGTKRDKAITTFLFVLYSLPSFWVATLLITFFCNPEYLNWFPSNGVQSTAHVSDWSFMKKIGDWAYHLILPTICYTYSSFAFLSRQMRVGMLEVINQDYIATARAKGLAEKVVVMKHALKNAVIPIITLIGGILPSLIGGSIILETIFSIPGMGFTMYNAVLARDYPMIIAFFTLLGLLTQMGILLSDILYVALDPRISFVSKA